MKVRNYTGHKVTIKQLGPHDARETTLGVMQAPDGNEDAQVTKLKKKKHGKLTYGQAESKGPLHVLRWSLQLGRPLTTHSRLQL